LKKPALIFVAAFALSLGLTLLPIFARVELILSFPTNIAESIAYNTLISTFFSLLGPAIFFVVFYFLTNRSKIPSVKPVIMALLLGVILGSAIVYLSVQIIDRVYLLIYLDLALGSVVSGVLQFFFPGLAALLFAELREKKSNKELMVQ
jgi:RsiW-degrading membrane proteinase PrsW (M82 family)